MKLLVFDVEGTLFETSVRLPGAHIDSTIWQALARRLGDVAVLEEVATHRHWEDGRYGSYLEWMRESIAIHVRNGLTSELFSEVISAARYNAGVRETFARIDRSRYEPVLVSGGFRELAKRAQVDLSIVHAFAACEYFFDSRGSLAGFNLLPCDFAGKIDFITLMLREYRLGADEWIFVGDGLNDVPIARSAPRSIAYRGHPRLREVTTHSVEKFESVLEYLD